MCILCYFFFFQAEDGIRDWSVTGVQTCALPIWNLASPWNVIYPKKYLDRDPNYFKTNVVGSGPFKFKSYTPGSTFEGERNPDYFVKDRPYLDGYKFFVSTETSVRAATLRSGRAWIEFRTMPQSAVESIRKQPGDKVVVREPPA